MGRGIVSGRVALLLRSTEIRPHRPKDLLPPSPPPNPGSSKSNTLLCLPRENPPSPRLLSGHSHPGLGRESGLGKKSGQGQRESILERESGVAAGVATRRGLAAGLRTPISEVLPGCRDIISPGLGTQGIGSPGIGTEYRDSNSRTPSLAWDSRVRDFFFP